MQDILEYINETASALNVNYIIVDLEGKSLYTKKHRETKLVNITTELVHPQKEVIPIQKSGLLLGYVIFEEKLSKKEATLFNRTVELAQHIHDANIERKLQFTKKTFWRNYLSNKLQKEEKRLLFDQFNVRQQSHYVIMVMRFFPTQDFTAKILEAVKDRVLYYAGWQHATVHTVQLRFGEGVLVIDLGKQKLEKTVEQLRILRRKNERLISDIRRSVLGKDEEVIIGAGNPVDSIDDVPDMFLSVRDFIRAASKLYQYSRIVLYEHIPIYTLLQHMTQKEAEEFTSTALKSIDPGDAETLHTLRATFESDLNVSAAAKELGIHRNTLEYRLKQIHKKTQLDPLSFFDGMQLYLAIMLLELNVNRKK